MKNAKHISETISFLVSKKVHFAIYSLPNTSQIILVIEQNKKTDDVFLIQAFDDNQTLLKIHQDSVFVDDEICLENLQKLQFTQQEEIGFEESVIESTQVQYENYVADVVAACAENKIAKSVAARVKKYSKSSSFGLGNYVLKIFQNYSDAFVHLYYHSACDLWLGATPELLVQQKENELFETVALAGTKLKSKRREWTEKEIVEQQIVTDYICKTLQDNEQEIVDVSKAKTIDAGLIQHLKSTILFRPSLSFEQVAKILHPTPAVCGMPKEKAKQIILQSEGNTRNCYTGFVGVNTKSTKALFVNLRCLQIVKNEFLIHVGAGITKDSIPSKEWQETENKAQTLLRFL